MSANECRCAYCHGVRPSKSLLYLKGQYYCTTRHYRLHVGIDKPDERERIRQWQPANGERNQ